MPRPSGLFFGQKNQVFGSQDMLKHIQGAKTTIILFEKQIELYIMHGDAPPKSNRKYSPSSISDAQDPKFEYVCY